MNEHPYASSSFAPDGHVGQQLHVPSAVSEFDVNKVGALPERDVNKSGALSCLRSSCVGHNVVSGAIRETIVWCYCSM